MPKKKNKTEDIPAEANKVGTALKLLKKLVEERDKRRVVDTASPKHEPLCIACDEIVKANEPQVILGKLVAKKQVFIYLHRQCAVDTRLK
jgi:hypothetical protein